MSTRLLRFTMPSFRPGLLHRQVVFLLHKTGLHSCK